ncbi:hypothetical protein V7S43_014482 [Phytophthora oleae]|uniref:Uncharacterized protein n=1 Tax=Phytophthora oleae TaxID=2107226 RepID=A0ABD3F0L7_9STRA
MRLTGLRLKFANFGRNNCNRHPRNEIYHWLKLRRKTRLSHLPFISNSSILHELIRRCLLLGKPTRSLRTRICLDKNWSHRKKTLLDAREQKFRSVNEYIMARIQPSYSSDDRFETAAGDVCAVLYQTVEFPGVESPMQVHDAVLFSNHNAEISISERLGHATTRDDYECGKSSIHNARIVSTNNIGVSTEVNCVMFSQFFDGVAESFVCEPRGIIALESVDEDELYPYKSSERIRKDVSSAVVVTARYEKEESTGCLRQVPSHKVRLVR